MRLNPDVSSSQTEDGASRVPTILPCSLRAKLHMLFESLAEITSISLLAISQSLVVVSFCFLLKRLPCLAFVLPLGRSSTYRLLAQVSVGSRGHSPEFRKFSILSHGIALLPHVHRRSGHH